MTHTEAEALLTAYLAKIYGYAYQKSFSYDEAEELASAIAEQLWRTLLSAGDVQNPDGYVYRICANVYAKHVAARRRHTALSLDDMPHDIPDEEADPVAAEEAARERRVLRREIAFLSQIRREIVYAYYYENKSVSRIAQDMVMPAGTVKWHLNKARSELSEGFQMERKTGKLGIHPITAASIGHSGTPGSLGGPEYYLEDKLSLNIVYSVYHTPRTREEIAEELGITPVFIDDKITTLAENGFLVPTTGGKYTTYVSFTPETFSGEAEDIRARKWYELAGLLVRDYVPAIRAALASEDALYLPTGNRELFEAAMIFWGIAQKCSMDTGRDLSRYHIRTKDGGEYIARVNLPAVPDDPAYTPVYTRENFWVCGAMNRWSERYPVSSVSFDTKYTTRTGAYGNNRVEDYEYLYESITGQITDTPANRDKFARLRSRGYLDENNRPQIMIARGTPEEWYEKIPAPDPVLLRRFTDDALAYAVSAAADYPPQMRDLIVAQEANSFFGCIPALLVTDLLYKNGTFREMTDAERITAQLVMFSDVLPT